jgi:hypothetical protein
LFNFGTELAMLLEDCPDQWVIDWLMKHGEHQGLDERVDNDQVAGMLYRANKVTTAVSLNVLNRIRLPYICAAICHYGYAMDDTVGAAGRWSVTITVDASVPACGADFIAGWRRDVAALDGPDQAVWVRHVILLAAAYIKVRTFAFPEDLSAAPSFEAYRLLDHGGIHPDLIRSRGA